VGHLLLAASLRPSLETPRTSGLCYLVRLPQNSDLFSPRMDHVDSTRYPRAGRKRCPSRPKHALLFHSAARQMVLVLSLFLLPDISLLGYAGGNKRAAATFYNTVHNYLGPASLGFASWKSSSLVGEQLALIWIAHIAFDRLLGFGLKYPVAFKPTHLQVLNTFRCTGNTKD
jgi:hypothetical protein